MGTARVSVQRLLPRSELTGGARAGRAPPRDLQAERALRGPLGVAQILDLSIELFLARFGIHVGIVAVFLLPLHLAAELWNLALPFELLFEEQPDVTPGLLAGSGFVLAGLACLPWGMARVFVASLVGAELLGRRPSVAGALAGVFQRLPGILFLCVVTTLATTVGLCACIVPVVLAAWLCEPALPAFALEARTGAGSMPDALQALRRARALASGGATFLRWLACTLASLVFALPFLLQVQEQLGLREVVQGALPAPLAMLVLALSVTLQQSVGLAFRSVVVSVFYLDQRMRKEGLDVELALARARAAAAPGELGAGGPLVSEADSEQGAA